MKLHRVAQAHRAVLGHLQEREPRELFRDRADAIDVLRRCLELFLHVRIAEGGFVDELAPLDDTEADPADAVFRELGFDERGDFL